MNQIFYTGCVENRQDPLFLGRVQVRVVGIHTDDKTILATGDLPWAHVMMPSHSASMNGLGWSPTGIVQGTWVVVVYFDEYNQQPLVLGTIGGIPQTASAKQVSDSINGVVTTDAGGDLLSSTGDIITDAISAIASGSSPMDGTSQSTGNKYQVNSVVTPEANGIPSSTIYNVVSIDNPTIVATATYDTNKQLYSVSLLNASSYNIDQYSPFQGGSVPMTFSTTQDITSYFDTNF